MKKDVTQHFGQVILHDTPADISATTKLGVCTLVSAGSGDPDLLTVRAVKAIETATVLLVDDAVSDAILALASPSARVVWVGQRGGAQPMAQSVIDKLIFHAVREGHQVVRIKGGSPFSFAWTDPDIEPLILDAEPDQKQFKKRPL
jgi:uroporphyrin-III C-methyltransferase